jgi:hypothetical protein
MNADELSRGLRALASIMESGGSYRLPTAEILRRAADEIERLTAACRLAIDAYESIHREGYRLMDPRDQAAYRSIRAAFGLDATPTQPEPQP